MNKTKFYIFCTITLLLSNLFLIGFMFFRDGNPALKKPREIIIKRLNFDDKQISAYDVIIKTHQLQIRTAEKDILRLKKELYGLLKEDKNDVKDSLVNELAKIQINIENAHFTHFQAIKKICTPNQMNDYNALILDFGKIFGGKPKPNQKK